MKPYNNVEMYDSYRKRLPSRGSGPKNAESDNKLVDLVEAMEKLSDNFKPVVLIGE